MSNKIEITNEMKYDLSNIVEKYRGWIEQKHDKEFPYNSDYAKKYFDSYIRTVNEFFHKQGFETRTCYYIEKSYFPKKGSWKFRTRRTRGLIWIQYDEDRFRSKCDSLERYWVGIPKELVTQILKARKFPNDIGSP